MKINEKIEALRQEMKRANLAACIVPISDPHLNEYQPDYWKVLTWITGFTGSAGTAVFTHLKAGLWVDSRYYLQAENELANAEIIVFKAGLTETPTITEWLKDELPAKSRVGLDGSLFSVSQTENLTDSLKTKGIELNTTFDPFPKIWKDRFPFPINPIFIYPEKYAGKSVSEKLEIVRKDLFKQQADAVLLTALDEIAWLFNLRGSDVDFNPVFVAYAYISSNENRIFIPVNKQTDEIKCYLQEHQIEVSNYDEIASFLTQIEDFTLLIDKNKVNATLLKSISSKARILFAPSPIALPKSIKNETELEGTRNAMIKDGIALTRFYKWLDETISVSPVSEIDLAQRLIAFKKEQDVYVSESFATIAGFAEHGAIVHYHTTKETDTYISAESFLLIDNGTQYLDGTTDITRTIALGNLTKQQKKDFTLVLKGHIAIASCIFPHGTKGAQIDVLARKALWENGLNYLHGTGHGVGHFLNVHEGPQNIRTEENATMLLPGMILSNEPGIYRAGEYGIRSENLIVVKEHLETDFGKFYAFETLTLFPFDTNAIDKDLLTPKEIQWLNNYHQLVFEKLSPHLAKEEKEWLRLKTIPI